MTNIKTGHTMNTSQHFVHSILEEKKIPRNLLNSKEIVRTKILMLWYIYCDDRVCSWLISEGRLPGSCVQINKCRLAAFFCSAWEQLLHYGEYKLYSFSIQCCFVPSLPVCVLHRAGSEALLMFTWQTHTSCWMQLTIFHNRKKALLLTKSLPTTNVQDL